MNSKKRVSFKLDHGGYVHVDDRKDGITIHVDPIVPMPLPENKEKQKLINLLRKRKWKKKEIQETVNELWPESPQ